MRAPSMSSLFTGRFSRLALFLPAPFAGIAVLILVFGGFGEWLVALGFAILALLLFTATLVLGFVDAELTRRQRERRGGQRV